MKFQPTALALIAATGIVLTACDKKSADTEAGNGEVTEGAPAPAPVTIPVTIFQPPSDGLLKIPQVKKFLQAHQALMKLDEIYLDRLMSASPANRRAIFGAMELAREKAARRFGLDGYEEYRWILEVAPVNPENRRLLEGMRIGVAGG
jgi:hypothetical protein